LVQSMAMIRLMISNNGLSLPIPGRCITPRCYTRFLQLPHNGVEFVPTSSGHNYARQGRSEM
jgi:hypothetical protein